MLIPTIYSTIRSPVVDPLQYRYWKAGQTLAQRLAAEYGVIAAGRYTDWTTGRLRATVGDDLNFLYAARTLAADGSTQAAGLAPLHTGKGVLHDRSRANLFPTDITDTAAYFTPTKTTVLGNRITVSQLGYSRIYKLSSFSAPVGPLRVSVDIVSSNMSKPCSFRIVQADDNPIGTYVNFYASEGVAEINVMITTAGNVSVFLYLNPDTDKAQGKPGDWIEIDPNSWTAVSAAFPLGYSLSPGTTTVATYGTTTTGVSLPAPVGGPVWNALDGGEMTLIVDDVRMAGSGGISGFSRIVGPNTTLGSYFSVDSPSRATDNTGYVVAYGTWSRNDNIVSVVNVRYNTTLATWQLRANYVNLTLGQTALALSDETGWMTYDGSFNPDSALQKLIFFYLNAYPGYLRRYVICNRNLTGAETMKLLTKDFTVPAYA